ncbi:MAG: hypothetical protein DRO39_09180 [Thermoprotei archaeon]|nr:MAG: hypothetical protein DRO39_09180 [Thermoprotei archaeon]
MLGVFGRVSRVRELGLEPDVVYVGLDRVNRFAEGVVPLLWVPKTSELEEGVVDAYGRRHLFAFGNSGCIANPRVVGRALKAVERVFELGFRRVMLDAIRLPSPVNGLLFLTTCFCSHSLELCPELGYLRNRVRAVLHSASAGDVVEVLEELAHARTAHVEYMLSVLYDMARELSVELVAAVFPYPLSRYVGQEPAVLKRYLSEVHVMLYHRCPGAACLNAELRGLTGTLNILRLGYGEIQEVIRSITGLELGVKEIAELDNGIALEHVEKLMDINRSIYGDAFTPILWLDDEVAPRLKRYLKKHRRIDVFAPLDRYHQAGLSDT